MGLFKHAVNRTSNSSVGFLVLVSVCFGLGILHPVLADDKDNGRQKPGPRMPINFSWVIDGKLAAMGFPGEDSNMAYLVENGITRLITLMEFEKPDMDNFPEMNSLWVKVVDFTPPTLEQIEQCLNYIDESLDSNKPVGIHCAHGRGRTGTVISCYFVKTYNLDPDEAIETLRSMRPGSVESREQEEMVRTYHKHLNTAAANSSKSAEAASQANEILNSKRVQQGHLPLTEL